MESADIKPDDDFIAVMGVTGAGKSTFVSQCTGSPPLNVGHGLESFTQRTTLHSFQHRGRTVHLIDTPGFNDTFRSDDDVFSEVAYTLVKAHQLGIRLGGIVYLQSMTDVRVQGSAVRSLRILEGLCGPDAYPSIVLAATHCESCSSIERDKKLTELRSKPAFWHDLCEGGSMVAEFRNTRPSALTIVDMLLDRGQRHILSFQRQMSRGMRLQDTYAGKQLQSAWSVAFDNLRQEMSELKGELQTALQQHRDAGAQRVKDDMQNLQTSLEAQQTKLNALNATAETLSKQWDKKLEDEHALISRRLGQIESDIVTLRETAGEDHESSSKPPSYEEVVKMLQSAREERDEIMSLKQCQLSERSLKVSKQSNLAAWVGVMAGVGSFGLALAPLMCSVM
ncbi:hypothetical protein LTR78_008936 [Recurvomyces mirabilis]|uniref:G domain-containing protein n=1 Tax=Recurvomyces mirabilis TaxID=574656 RepID=A0AAE0TQ44_9PEZI|nr:hypothetical protein LTR78_008936 [Recurvomyces mirabilis]KAK5159737.1 hypothetical protein LTS14_001842 [Recurvomyces mirabilis]